MFRKNQVKSQVYWRDNDIITGRPHTNIYFQRKNEPELREKFSQRFQIKKIVLSRNYESAFMGFRDRLTALDFFSSQPHKIE